MPDRFDREQAARRTADEQGLVLRQALGAVAEQLEAHLALDAMGAGDGGKRDPALAIRRRTAHDYSAFSASSVGRSLFSRSFGSGFLGRSFLGRSFLGRQLPQRQRLRPELPRRRFLGRSFLGGGLFSRSFVGGASSAAPSAGSWALSPVTSAASSPASVFGRIGFFGGSFLGGSFLGRQPPRPELPRPAASSTAGSSAGAFLAASAASAASAALVACASTRSLAFSPGSPFLGLLRAGALADAGGIEEAQDAVRRLGADRQPMRDALGVELHALGQILGQQRIVGAELLDEAAVARGAAVGDDDAVIRPLLGAAAGEANCKCHFRFLSVSSFISL